MTIYYTYLDTPIQQVLLTCDGTSLLGLYMARHGYGPEIGEDWMRLDGASPFPETREQLGAYFGGVLTEFNLPLILRGTAFQQRVWDELKTIPYGVTIAYGGLARRLGIPDASRAVGLAIGRNPISIIVPCHRVIGSRGNLTGYGGGLSRKEALLALEASALPRRTSQIDRTPCRVTFRGRRRPPCL